LFKLMAYKDEYEVARLYTDGSFQQQLDSAFEGDYRLKLHLAPPLIAKLDPATGRPRKIRFGPWMMTAFRLLARVKGLRGTRFDMFGRSAERQRERQLIADYEALLDELKLRLRPDTYDVAVALAELPEQIRGFGPVKLASVERARARERQLLDTLRGEGPARKQAA
jgi:indolepyruvate ferredoxin oxidoreductase